MPNAHPERRAVPDDSAVERSGTRPADPSRQDLLPIIERAKQEWECTVDALSVLVCLLDADGVVLRANRVVEQWGLSSVGAVAGKTAHDLLHAERDCGQCELARMLDGALSKTAGGDAQEFEYPDAGGRTLHVMLRPMLAGEAANPLVRDSRSVLVVTDVSALRQAQRALIDANTGLEARIRQRTRELASSNVELRNEAARRGYVEQELRASRNNLALLSEELIQAQELERSRIALELHDSVGQQLSAIKYTLERAMVLMEQLQHGRAADVLALAVQRVHETADGVRAISMNLRPQVLDNLGAAAAAQWFCRGFAATYPHIALVTRVSAENADIPPRIAIHLFRCVQELLNNVAKHSQAKTAWLNLSRDGHSLALEVSDDGVGMHDGISDPLSMSGTGIRNLRERVQMTGGEFSLTSQPGCGARARIAWTLSAAEFGGPDAEG